MNRSSDSILSVYSDARAEYTKQLCVFLVPAYFQFFINLLEKSKQAMTTTPKRSLWQFQNYLNEIHDWNMEKVNNEIHTIYTNCGCDYLDDLLTAVFIAYTKVLTAIRLSSNKKKIEINVPTSVNEEDIIEWLYANEHLYTDKLADAMAEASLDFGFGLDADEGFDDYDTESETRFDFLDGDGGSMGGHL